jgi:hypothetical protein
MMKLILFTLFALLFFTYSPLIADEGDVERLMVPQEHKQIQSANDDEPTEVEEPISEQMGDNTTSETMNNATAPAIEEERGIAPSAEEQAQTGEEETPPPSNMQDDSTYPVPTAEEEQKQVEQVQQGVQAQEEREENIPDVAMQEASHAEESELQEVGAGEEPIIEP